MVKTNQAEREKISAIGVEKRMKTFFYQSSEQKGYEDILALDKTEPFHPSKWLSLGEVTNSRAPFSFLLDEKRETQNNFSWDMGIDKIRKVNSARKILRDLNQYYESIFGRNYDALEEDISEKQVFFNSNFLYLIATTDGNEDTLGHSQLVSSYTLMLTKALGIGDKNYLVDIQRGALLHDIGKIGIPESILRKPGSLTIVEREIIKEHPLLGYEMIEELNFLKKASQIVLFHHESFDGSGYPYGLVANEIPLDARIFSLADTLDAITSDRPYRKGRSFEEAFREIEKGRGSQFDPLVVDAFFSIHKEKWQQIKAETEESLRLYTVH